jgi:hypothetical protein
MANLALPIGWRAQATNVSAANVFATAAGSRESVALTALTALTPLRSAQGGGYSGADRRCQPSSPRACSLRPIDQVLTHFQRAMRQGPRLGVGGERVFVRVTRRIGLVVAHHQRRIAAQFGEQRLGQARIVVPEHTDARDA